MWVQRIVQMSPRRRGFHLIDNEIQQNMPELTQIKIGLLHLLIQHTSASLAINENADPSVRCDMESFFSRIAPENEPYFTHTLEGSDDMPAHLKNVILGAQLTIPINNGRLLLGTWQGIYLCEHRDVAGMRSLVMTLFGE